MPIGKIRLAHVLVLLTPFVHCFIFLVDISLLSFCISVCVLNLKKKKKTQAKS